MASSMCPSRLRAVPRSFHMPASGRTSATMVSNGNASAAAPCCKYTNPHWCISSSVRSAALEYRLALFDEGTARFLGVLRLAQHDGDALLEAIAVARRHVHGGVHRLLGIAHANGALRGDLGSNFHGFRHELFQRHAAFHYASAIEFVRRHAPAGIEHAPGA